MMDNGFSPAYTSAIKPDRLRTVKDGLQSRPPIICRPNSYTKLYEDSISDFGVGRHDWMDFQDWWHDGHNVVSDICGLLFRIAGIRTFSFTLLGAKQ
jgi:hypothetical protein